MNETTLARSTVPELPLLARGKVRDIYDLGKLVGLELGGATLLGVLAASASYIAAAHRLQNHRKIHRSPPPHHRTRTPGRAFARKR